MSQVSYITLKKSKTFQMDSPFSEQFNSEWDEVYLLNEGKQHWM